MTDQYQAFANSPFGKLVVSNLGLPAPLQLKRAKAGQPDVQGDILWGAATNSLLVGAVAQVFKDLPAVNVHCGDHSELKTSAEIVGLKLKHFYAGDQQTKLHGLVFDASGIDSIDELKALYDFFQPVVRQVQGSGRVVILATTPEQAGSVEKAIAQRALEGFVKSLGKELKKGITAQLVYVDPNASANLASTLRFLLSPRSAYVSGQVIHVNQAESLNIDWEKPLQGKTALVTGASRGIGEAIAETLARDGAYVICLDVPQQQADLDRVAAKIGGTTLALDITAADAGEKIKQAATQHGGLDILVHNAGVTRDKTLARMTPQFWDMVMNINLASNARVNDYLLNNDGLNANARIVCVSSISGIAGNLGQSNYATSKAGVIGLVKFTAPTLQNGITINAVAPGFIETQMTAAIPFAIREAGRRMNSMSQGGLPVDVAETIAYFASPSSSGLNGNVVRVCGQSLLGA
ncbi:MULTISPECIES: 3-oxoacyl-ACP reductase [unclassified Acinetobacter]|uniref:3-oxoacyl-ACP reductase n=1 Tax=unclassified Acinetobacter TaxID=196816 RepID=UPI0035B75C3E